MGNLERLRKNYDDAIKYYKSAIEIDPQYANGFSELSWVYLETNQIKKSREAYKKALNLAGLDSHKSKIKEYYARCHFQIGKVDEARKLVLEAIKLDKKKENLELLEWICTENELQEFKTGV